MNNPWVKILVFGLLFGIGGFLIGRCCGGGCHKGGCDKEAACHGKGACSEGGAEAGKDCCKGGGHHGGHGSCGKAQGSCKGACKGDCGGHCGGACGEGGKACCKGMMHGDDKAQVVIDGLVARNFQGDTTVAIDGGTVNVKRTGDKMEVKVEMRDSVSKTVEVHAH